MVRAEVGHEAVDIQGACPSICLIKNNITVAAERCWFTDVRQILEDGFVKSITRGRKSEVPATLGNFVIKTGVESDADGLGDGSLLLSNVCS